MITEKQELEIEIKSLEETLSKMMYPSGGCGFRLTTGFEEICGYIKKRIKELNERLRSYN